MSLTPEEKKKLSESDICDLYITPAVKDAGWDPFTQGSD
jgi:type I restriction enzyme R subunit